MNGVRLDELIKNAQKGDRSSFELLLREMYDVIFRMALKWCGRKEDAEDITQQVCIKLARSISEYRFNAKFTSWIYRIVINTAIDFYKGKSNSAHVSYEDLSIGSDNDDPEKLTEARMILEKIYLLPEREKTALLLVFAEDLSHLEAAKVMGCKESTVSWYIHEARKKLEKLRKEGAGNHA